jgi:hypothetical protein
MCDLCVTECGWGPHFLKYWKYNHKLQPGASNYTDTMVHVAKYYETMIPATHCTLLPQITMLHECFSGVWLEKYDSCWIIIAKMYSTVPLNNLVNKQTLRGNFAHPDRTRAFNPGTPYYGLGCLLCQIFVLISSDTVNGSERRASRLRDHDLM